MPKCEICARPFETDERTGPNWWECGPIVIGDKRFRLSMQLDDEDGQRHDSWDVKVCFDCIKKYIE